LCELLQSTSLAMDFVTIEGESGRGNDEEMGDLFYFSCRFADSVAVFHSS
jgi:hypothetical protein